MNSISENGAELHDGASPEEMRYGLKSMEWFGWGSPIGLGSFLVSIGLFLMLLHYARLIG